MKPSVSIIIPCYNEEKTIHMLLESLLRQSYPLASLEVVIADGMSTDQTRQKISIFQQSHPELILRVVDNPHRSIPAALNCALQAAEGQYIIRLDAHSMPQDDYIEKCIQALEEGCGDNVGGVWDIRPGSDSWVAHSIAVAASHPLAVGDAKYRYTTKASEVETVPFGAFRRDLVMRLGGFDETLLTNEDYEFNTRIRKNGGRIWLDPAIRSVYFARSSLNALVRQYWRYGYWKLRMLRRYPETIRWRQGLPPMFVLSLITLGLTAPFWVFIRYLLLLEIAVYFLIIIFVGLQLALQKRSISFLFGVPLSIATMQICWGAGFLWSLVTLGRRHT